MIAWFLLGSAIAYGVVITVYRLHIHPLSRFPGPRLAALTGLYEVVCTVRGSGSFDDEIDRLHRIYGDIVPRAIGFINWGLADIVGRSHRPYYSR